MSRETQLAKLKELRKNYPDPNDLYTHLSPEQQDLIWELVDAETKALKISDERKAEYEKNYGSKYKDERERAKDNVDDLLAVGYKPIQLYKELSHESHNPIVGSTNKLKMDYLYETFKEVREYIESKSTTNTTSKSEPDQKSHQSDEEYEKEMAEVLQLMEDNEIDNFDTLLEMFPQYTDVVFWYNTKGGKAKRSTKGGSKPKKTSKKKSKKTSKKKSKKKGKKSSMKK